MFIVCIVNMFLWFVVYLRGEIYADLPSMFSRLLTIIDYIKYEIANRHYGLRESIIIIIIIIAPLTIVSDDQWGDLECLYKACQAARTDGG